MQTIGTAAICVLLLFSLEVHSLCSPETECFGHGKYDRAKKMCECYSIPRMGQYTGECCESIDCDKPNATCKHGYCGLDGVTCEKCQTGWGGPNCENVTSCFPWFHCNHGSCTKSRSKCECESGWVGDLCDRSVCQVPCKFGSCPNDPKKCECYENYYGPTCNGSVCADDWECQNGGYCVDLHHCVCPPHYAGTYCETVSECGVPCEHGKCTQKPDVCECEANWGPPGNCSIYEGPCLNCSSVGGSCKNGPHTCECKPGYMGPQCSVQTCEGCAHGRCYHGPHGKSCACDSGWRNQHIVRGFDPIHGPCTKVKACMEPCVHGSCPNDPYVCECTSPYAGSHCDTMKCPVCCPPQTCDCSNPTHIKCRPRWHHDCCLVRSCFRGDTLVHTAKGLVPIENVKEGDMVVTRHEAEDRYVTHLRRVDQVRTSLVPATDLIVFRMYEEDIWVTADHPFFEIETSSWISAVNVTTSHSLQGLKGKMVKLQQQLKASKLLSSSGEANLVAVYDLSVFEYDRYAVGKNGLLVSACTDVLDLVARDEYVWYNLTVKFKMTKLVPSTEHHSESDGSNPGPGFPTAAVVGGVLGAIFLALFVVLLFIVILYRGRRKKREDAQPLLADS